MRVGPDRHLARLPEGLRATAKVFANGEIAWPNEDAENAINELADAGHIITALAARSISSKGQMTEIPIGEWTDQGEPREAQVDAARTFALEALPSALAEGDFVLIDWE